MKNSQRTTFLLLLIASIAVGACRKQPATTPPTNNASPVAEVSGGGAVPAGEKFFLHGTIADELKIEMTLVRDHQDVTGTYFYPKVGKNISLKGTVDKDGNLDLRESDDTGKETGVFKGKWSLSTELADSNLIEIAGKWSRPDGSKETEFHLYQHPIEFSGAAHQVPKVIKDANKTAHYIVDVIYPQIEGESRFDKFNSEARSMITKEVGAFKAGETAANSEPDLELPVETQDSSFYVNYHFRLATDDLISVEFLESSYSRGAAHPNSLTSVINYDVKNGKKLALADLFTPKSNYLSLISAYCIKDLKQQSQKDKDTMLMDDMIQSGAAARADNYRAWAITKKGLWVTFDPYQVAAYAAGPQHVLVPYSALKDIIKPDGPIAGLAK